MAEKLDQPASGNTLPCAIFDALLEASFRAEPERSVAIADIVRSHPEHGDVIRAHLAEVDAQFAEDAMTPDTNARHTNQDQIGPYRILGSVGKGGMGEVYLASRRDLAQHVALKVIKLGFDTKDVLARFAAERNALARMKHDNIARILDAGTSEAGRPYFVMEFVAGKSITEHCDENRLSIEARLELLQQVCAGVQHAHSKSVLHRDLKPSNILVVHQDGKAMAKIIDFGLARALDADGLTDMSRCTREGYVLGTTEFMSPEQAGRGEVDTRTDVYSLGVLLYQLLTGTLPFTTAELGAMSKYARYATIRDTEPETPSARLSANPVGAEVAARAQSTDRDTLLKQLSGDLDWVAMKCLEKDPDRRYGTPSELAADLQRYLHHEPLLARPPSAAYRARKLLRRYRLLIAGVAATLVALGSGLGVVTHFWREAVSRKREFDQLAAVGLLARLESDIAEINDCGVLTLRWLEEYLRRATDLLALRPGLQTSLQVLRSRADHVDAEPNAGSQSDLARTGEHTGETTPVPWQHVGSIKLPAPAPPPRYTFHDSSDEFLHDTLSKLLDDLARFQNSWYPRLLRKLTWARQVCALSRTHPNAPTTWDAARAAISQADGVVASELYREQRIVFSDEDVVGLVPIGMNPQTKLWEFYDLRSAWDGRSDPASIAIPRHSSHPNTLGHIEHNGDSGIVFVLLPGKPSEHKADTPTSLMAPFFMARHELTVGQWERLSNASSTKANPPRYYPEFPPLPVCRVNWEDSTRLARSHRLRLPTVAQWEYGCRAGTASTWWSGDSPLSLNGVANIFDRDASDSRAAKLGDRKAPEADFADGADCLAPVGSYRCNPFGLFDTHGNVSEWCEDEATPATPEVVGRGLVLGHNLEDAQANGGTERVLCGGGFASQASDTRVDTRFRAPPELRCWSIGLRVIRPLQRR